MRADRSKGNPGGLHHSWHESKKIQVSPVSLWFCSSKVTGFAHKVFTPVAGSVCTGVLVIIISCKYFASNSERLLQRSVLSYRSGSFLMSKYTFMSEALQLQGCLENHKGIYSCPG